MIIQDDIIKAEEGKLLVYTPENILWGKVARLANYKGRQLTVDDFEEVDEDLVINIDGTNYIFVGQSYSEIKTFIIKLHYSNDDQIAIMLNNDENKMNQMQEWREYAASIARKYNPI